MTDPDSAEEQEIGSALLSFGARFDPEVLARTREIYRPHVRIQPWGNRRAVHDVVYGPEERHRLDIYPADVADAPILIFFHGGGFVGGDKRGDDEFYGNVGRYFAAYGFLTILANYRLAPQFTWPAGNEDVRAVLMWVSGNAAAHCGNSQKIILIGQSAGASHVAGYLFDPHFNGRDNRAIRGAVLMSGFYLAKQGMLPGPLKYYGEDPAAWAECSPATHAVGASPPLLLSYAELDPGQIAEQTFEFALALNHAAGRPPRIDHFEGHNHVSTVHGLGIGRDVVGLTLRNFALRCLTR